MFAPLPTFDDITRPICMLLECTDVIFALASPGAKECHPLLSFLPVQEEDILPQLLRNELYKSSAIVPLVQPAGLLGFLVCIDSHCHKFLQGEHSLLKQVAPNIAREVESTLAAFIIQALQEHPSPSLHEAMPQQQTLTSLVGHDLRVPLTAIKGYTGLLQAYGSNHENMTPELQQQYLNSIMEQTHHMEVLVNDLLDVSHIQSGQLRLHCTWVNIVYLSQRILRVMQDTCDQQHPGKYMLHCRFDTSTKLVWADPNRVRQVLLNLVENAIKYSPDGGMIEVRVRNSASFSSITVRDWGLGIPSLQQESLFQAFQRGRSLEQGGISGLGLGLYIVRTLVEAMDGTIMLRSSKEKGTSISFTLPNAEPVHQQGPQELYHSVAFTERYSTCEKLSSLL